MRQKFWPLFLFCLPIAIIGMFAFFGIASWIEKAVSLTVYTTPINRESVVTITLRNGSLWPIRYLKGCGSPMYEVNKKLLNGFGISSSPNPCTGFTSSIILWPFQSVSFTVDFKNFVIDGGEYSVDLRYESLFNTPRYFFRSVGPPRDLVTSKWIHID